MVTGRNRFSFHGPAILEINAPGHRFNPVSGTMLIFIRVASACSLKIRDLTAFLHRTRDDSQSSYLLFEGSITKFPHLLL